MSVVFEALKPLLRHAPAPYTGSITLSEHETLTCELPSATVFQSIAALFENACAKGLISVQSRVAVDGRIYLQLRSSNKVGFVALTAQGERIFVQVRPKIDAVRMLDLAYAGGMLPTWSRGDAPVATDPATAVMDWTLQAFAAEAGRLISAGGIRRTHERTREDLKGRLRGKLLVRPYMENLVRGLHHVVPSEFQSLQVDNPHNQLLLRAVSTARVLCSLRPEGPLASLGAKFGSLERRLQAGISTNSSTEALLRSTQTLPVNMRHYSSAKRLAEMILGKAWLGAEAGPNTAPSLVLDMNEIYQRAFSALFLKQVPEVHLQARWPIHFRRLDASAEIAHQTIIRPDLWVPPARSRSPIVIDTKWKSAFGAGAAEESVISSEFALVRVGTADIYQVATYALKALSLLPASFGQCIASLVYPSLGPVADSSFQFDCGDTRIEVLLQSWDLSRPSDEAVSDLWNRLQTAASARSQVEPSIGGVLRVLDPRASVRETVATAGRE